jgi:hypothetical protein
VRRSPRTAADAPVGLLFVNRSQSRTRGAGADEGVRPTPRDTTLAALVVSLPAGRGSATPSYVAHALEAGRAIRFEANLASVSRKLAISMGFVR